MDLEHFRCMDLKHFTRYGLGKFLEAPNFNDALRGE